MISSISNAQIKNLIQLQKKSKARKEEGVFVCEGIKMFEEAAAFHDGRIKKAYISESLYNESGNHINSLKEVDFEIVADSVFKEAAETMTPQGILAIIKQPSYSLSHMMSDNHGRLLLLEDIRDPGNLGTIIRTAEGAGFTGVILSKGCVDIFNPKVIRSTMGAIYRVPFFYSDDFYKTITDLKEQNVSVYAAHLEGACFYDTIAYEEKTAIMIGNEANGLSNESAALSTRCIKIPMEGKVESLNAGIAAAILMYEVYRQLKNS